jgi:hypothetical protein
MVGLEPFVLARNALSDSHIFAAMIAAINALNSFFLPSCMDGLFLARAFWR